MDPRKKSNEEIEDIICHLSLPIIEESRGDNILFHHLLVTFLFTQGTLKNLKSEYDARLLHPSQDMPNFMGNEDNMGMSLKHKRDVLNRRWL